MDQDNKETYIDDIHWLDIVLSKVHEFDNPYVIFVNGILVPSDSMDSYERQFKEKLSNCEIMSFNNPTLELESTKQFWIAVQSKVKDMWENFEHIIGRNANIIGVILVAGIVLIVLYGIMVKDGINTIQDILMSCFKFGALVTRGIINMLQLIIENIPDFMVLMALEVARRFNTYEELEELDKSRPVILVGHSHGSIVSSFIEEFLSKQERLVYLVTVGSPLNLNRNSGIDVCNISDPIPMLFGRLKGKEGMPNLYAHNVSSYLSLEMGRPPNCIIKSYKIE